jgi:hypothetical protein
MRHPREPPEQANGTWRYYRPVFEVSVVLILDRTYAGMQFACCFAPREDEYGLHLRKLLI